MFQLLSLGICKIKGIDTELIRHRHIGVIRYTPRDPMMAANRLEPPNLINIRDCNAIHLVRSARLEQPSKPTHAIAGRCSVRQNQRRNVFLADTTRHLGNIALLALCTARGNQLD